MSTLLVTVILGAAGNLLFLAAFRFRRDWFDDPDLAARQGAPPHSARSDSAGGRRDARHPGHSATSAPTTSAARPAAPNANSG